MTTYSILRDPYRQCLVEPQTSESFCEELSLVAHRMSIYEGWLVVWQSANAVVLHSQICLADVLFGLLEWH